MNNIVKENLDDIPENFKQYSQQDIKKESVECNQTDPNKFIFLLILFLLFSYK